MVQSFKDFWCRVFGHSFSRVALLVFQIKTNARNAHIGLETAKIKCRVCGKTFVHKDSSLADKDELILDESLPGV